jgi:chemotaxis protein MotA
MFVMVGFVVVLGCVLGGFVMAGGPIPVLIQPAELVIIGGAALGSTVISTPMPVLKAMGAQIGGTLKARPGKAEYLELLGML